MVDIRFRVVIFWPCIAWWQPARIMVWCSRHIRAVGRCRGSRGEWWYKARFSLRHASSSNQKMTPKLRRGVTISEYKGKRTILQLTAAAQVVVIKFTRARKL